MLDYVIGHFEKYIKEIDVQKALLDVNPAPENKGDRKAIDDCLKEMLLECC